MNLGQAASIYKPILPTHGLHESRKTKSPTWKSGYLIDSFGGQRRNRTVDTRIFKTGESKKYAV